MCVCIMIQIEELILREGGVALLIASQGSGCDGRTQLQLGGTEEKKKRKLAGSGKHVDTSPSGPTGIRIPGHLGFGIALIEKEHISIPTCSPHGSFKSVFASCYPLLSLFSILFFLSLILSFPNQISQPCLANPAIIFSQKLPISKIVINYRFSHLVQLCGPSFYQTLLTDTHVDL